MIPCILVPGGNEQKTVQSLNCNLAQTLRQSDNQSTSSETTGGITISKINVGYPSDNVKTL